MPRMLLVPSYGKGCSEPVSVEHDVERVQPSPGSVERRQLATFVNTSQNPQRRVKGEGDAGACERCGGGGGGGGSGSGSGACSPECAIRGTCGIGNEVCGGPPAVSRGAGGEEAEGEMPTCQSDLVYARPVRVLEEGEDAGGELSALPLPGGARGTHVRGSECPARQGEPPALSDGRARERTSVLVDGCDLARRPHGNECQVLQQTGTGGGCAGSRSHDTVGEAHAPRYPGEVIGSVLVFVGEILWEYPVFGSDDAAPCGKEDGDCDEWLLVLSDQDWEAAINSDGELVTMSSDNESVAGSRPPHTSTAQQHPDINKCQSSIYGFKIVKNENVKVKKLLPVFTSSRSSSSQNITNSVTFRVKGDSTWQTNRANRNSDVCDMQMYRGCGEGGHPSFSQEAEGGGGGGGSFIKLCGVSLGSRPASPDPYPLFRSATLPRKMSQTRYSSVPPGPASRAMSPLFSPVSSQIFEFPSGPGVPPASPSAQESSAAARRDELSQRNGCSENAARTQAAPAHAPGDTCDATGQNQQHTQVSAPNGPCIIIENKSLEEQTETECVTGDGGLSSTSGAYDNSSSQSLPHFSDVPKSISDKQDICTVSSKVPCDGDAKITAPESVCSVGGTVGATSGGPVAPGSDLDVTCGTTTCSQPKLTGKSTASIEQTQPLKTASQSAIAQNDVNLREMRTSGDCETFTSQDAVVPLEEVTTTKENTAIVAPLLGAQEGDTKPPVDEKLVISEMPVEQVVSRCEGEGNTCLRITEPALPQPPKQSSDVPSSLSPNMLMHGQTPTIPPERKSEAGTTVISTDFRKQKLSQKSSDVIMPRPSSPATSRAPSKEPGEILPPENSSPSEVEDRVPTVAEPVSRSMSGANSDAAIVFVESHLTKESKEETTGEDSHYISSTADQHIALQEHVHGNESVIKDKPCAAKESQVTDTKTEHTITDIGERTNDIGQQSDAEMLDIAEPVREDPTSTESAKVPPSPVKLPSSRYTQAPPLQDVSTGLHVAQQSCHLDNELFIAEDNCISQNIEKDATNGMQTHVQDISIECNSETENTSPPSAGSASVSQPPALPSDSDSVEGESNRSQAAEQIRVSVRDDSSENSCRQESSSDVPGETHGNETVRGDSGRLSDSGASDIDNTSDKQLITDKCHSDEKKAPAVTSPASQRDRTASIGGGRGRTPSREESVGAEPSASVVGRGPGISERAALIQQQVCVRPRSRTTHFPLDIVCGTKLQHQQTRTKLDAPDRVVRQRNSSLGHVHPLVVDRDATARSKSASRIGSGSSEAVSDCLRAAQEESAVQEARGAPHAAAKSESSSRAERALPPIPRPLIAPLDAALKNKIKMTIDSCGDSCSGSESPVGAASHARGESGSPAVDRRDSGNESSAPLMREIVPPKRKSASQPTTNCAVREEKKVHEENDESNEKKVFQNEDIKSRSEICKPRVNIIESGPELHVDEKIVTKDVNDAITPALKDENSITIDVKNNSDAMPPLALNGQSDVEQISVVNDSCGVVSQAGVSDQTDAVTVVSNQSEAQSQPMAKSMTVIMLPAVTDHADATAGKDFGVDTDTTLPASVKEENDVTRETAVKDQTNVSVLKSVSDLGNVTPSTADKNQPDMVLPTGISDTTPAEEIKVSAEVGAGSSVKTSSDGAPPARPSAKEPHITSRRSQGRMPTPVCLPPSRASGICGFGPETWLNAVPLRYGRESERSAGKRSGQCGEGNIVTSDRGNLSEGSVVASDGNASVAGAKNELFIEEDHVEGTSEAKGDAGGEVVLRPAGVTAGENTPRRRTRDSLLLSNQSNLLFIDESAPDLCDQEQPSSSNIEIGDSSGVDVEEDAPPPSPSPPEPPRPPRPPPPPAELLQTDAQVCVTSKIINNECGRNDLHPSATDEFEGSALPSHARPVNPPATRDGDLGALESGVCVLVTSVEELAPPPPPPPPPRECDRRGSLLGREGSQDDYEQALEVATPDPGHGFSHSCTSVATVVRVDTPNQQPPSRPPPPEDDEAEDVFVDARDDVALVATATETLSLPEVDQHQQLQASSPTLMETSPATSEHSAVEAGLGTGVLSQSTSDTQSSGISGTSSADMSATSSRSMTGTQSTSSSGGMAKAIRPDARRPLVLIRQPGSDALEDGSVSSGGHMTDPDMLASASASASSTGSEASWTSSGGPVARRDLLPLDEDEDEVQWRALLAVNPPESEEERTGYESDEDFDTMDAEMRRLEEKLRRFEKELGDVPEDSSGNSETKVKGSSGGPPGPMLRSEDLEALRISPLPKVFPSVCKAKTKHLSLMTKLDLQQYGESDSESDSESDRVSSDSDSADFLFVKTKIKLKPGDRKCRSLEQRRSKNMNVLNESRDAKKREKQLYVCEERLDLSNLAIPRDPAEDDSFSVGYEEQEKFDIPPPPPPPVGYGHQVWSESDVGRDPTLPEGQDEPYPPEMLSDEMLDDDGTMYYSGEDQSLLGYIWQEEDGMAAVDFEGLEDFQSFKGQSALMFMFEDDLDDDCEIGQHVDNGDVTDYELKQPAAEQHACDNALPAEPPGGAPPRTRRGSQKSSDRTFVSAFKNSLKKASKYLGPKLESYQKKEASHGVVPPPVEWSADSNSNNNNNVTANSNNNNSSSSSNNNINNNNSNNNSDLGLVDAGTSPSSNYARRYSAGLGEGTAGVYNVQSGRVAPTSALAHPSDSEGPDRHSCSSGEFYAAPALCVNTSDEDPPAPPRRPQEALGQPPAPPPRWVQRRSYVAKDVDSDALMRRLSQTSQASHEGCWFSTLPPANMAPHPSFQAPVNTFLPPHQVPPLLLPLSNQPLPQTAATAPAQTTVPGFPDKEMQFYLVGTPTTEVDIAEPEVRRRSRGTGELDDVQQVALPVSPSHADSCPPPVTWAPGYYDKCFKMDNYPGVAPHFCPNHGNTDAIVELPPGGGPPLTPTHRPTSIKQLKRKQQEKALRQEAEEGIEGCTFCVGVPLMRSRPPEDSTHWRQSSPHPRAITDRRSWPPRVSGGQGQ
ncbi:platelet binding protein GspB-like isoform X2 [Penaeus japonicus]|uniref:platelet binding protein GspB-like isoform X2 n=1 Tax=Penaeus japonicus TaxID=27405 RepID=UPI001C717939|nr:platelet binding protein GspB-like isoform X2 [Penaeus japonicus]